MDSVEHIYISEKNFRSRYEYTNADLLGEGGFAQVYKAYDKQFKEHVALKFYNKGEQGKYDVLHEMKDSRMFSHKNIIRVYDAFVVKFEHTGVDSYVQIGVLEFANGGNLRDFIHTKPSESHFIKVLIGILSALEYLHTEKHIIHRDLTPENILMYKDHERWIPKIADFGISKKILGAPGQPVDKSTQLLGKVDYMAPEQFDPEKFGINKKLNTNVDLWAFGIILYELFTHEKPFNPDATTDNPVKIIQSITRDSLKDLDEIPNPYRNIIRRCLVKKASKRVQTARELINVLEVYQKSIEDWGLGTSNGKKSKKSLKYVGIAALSLVTLAVLIFTGIYLVDWQNERMVKKHIERMEQMVADKQIDKALSYYDNLSNKYQLEAGIVNLYSLAQGHKNTIDSLHMMADNLFTSQQLEEAGNVYNLIISDFQPDDQKAVERLASIQDQMSESSSGQNNNEELTVSEVETEKQLVEADFIANVSSGNAPLTVHFIDQSTGAPTSWEWDFNNDGIVDAQSKSPRYTFREEGTYSVKLITKNSSSQDEKIKEGYIIVRPPALRASFTSDKTSGEVPLTVQFRDQSSGNPNSWDWDFNNDGKIDAITQNPQYTFDQSGSYSVKLMVENGSLRDSNIKSAYIKAAPKKTVYRNFTFRRPPADPYTKLRSVEITELNTIINLEFLPRDKSVIIYPVGSEGAFFIEYNNRQDRMYLKDIKGITTGTSVNIDESKTVELLFDKLPQDVMEFNLIEGQNRLDESKVYRNYIGIKLN